MPNLPGRGLFGGTNAAPADGVWGTITGTIPLPAIEVWAGDANGVPVLVWAAAAGAPTGVTAVYSQVGGSHVTVSWTPHTTVIPDLFEIRRQDGSLAGTVANNVTTFVDATPRPVTGVYTVRAVLGDEGAAAASATLNLSTAPQSLAGSWLGTPDHGWYLSWAAPTWGTPDGYNIYANGVLVGTSITPGFVHQYVTPNSNINYTVAALLDGVAGTPTGALNKTRGSGLVTNLTITENGQNFADDNWLDITWTLPAYGTPDQLVLEFIDEDGTTITDYTYLAGNVTSWRTPPGVNRGRVGFTTRVRVRSVFNSVGQYTTAIASYANPASYPLNMIVSTGVAGPAIVIEWTPPVGGWTTFTVEVLSNPTPYSVTQTWPVGPTGKRVATITGLISSNGTYARVRANSNGGSSPWVLAGPFNPGVFGSYTGVPQ